jgi:hypothetical protein
MSVGFLYAYRAHPKLTGAGLGQQTHRSFPKAFRKAHGTFFFHAFAGLGDQSRHAVIEAET